MATLKQIRQRIKTAKNIRQITRAMKLVAAARLRRATDRVLEARPYSEKLREIIVEMGSAGELPAHPLMEKRPDVKRICLIVVTSERGLAGGYNTNLLRKAHDFVKEQSAEVVIISVGKKATGFFNKQGKRIVLSLPMDAASANLDDANQVANTARELFESGEVDAIYVCYSKFYSAMRQVPQVVQLLPIEPPQQEGGTHGPNLDFQFEPDPSTLLNTLLPRYFFTLIWQALLEASASEHGARMTAMTSATDNAGKMIETLTLKANRERQAGITSQIMEIVGGAEALKG